MDTDVSSFAYETVLEVYPYAPYEAVQGVVFSVLTSSNGCMVSFSSLGGFSVHARVCVCMLRAGSCGLCVGFGRCSWSHMRVWFSF